MNRFFQRPSDAIHDFHIQNAARDSLPMASCHVIIPAIKRSRDFMVTILTSPETPTGDRAQVLFFFFLFFLTFLCCAAALGVFSIAPYESGSVVMLLRILKEFLKEFAVHR